MTFSDSGQQGCGSIQLTLQVCAAAPRELSAAVLSDSAALLGTAELHVASAVRTIAVQVPRARLLIVPPLGSDPGPVWFLLPGKCPLPYVFSSAFTMPAARHPRHRAKIDRPVLHKNPAWIGGFAGARFAG